MPLIQEFEYIGRLQSLMPRISWNLTHLSDLEAKEFEGFEGLYGLNRVNKFHKLKEFQKFYRFGSLIGLKVRKVTCHPRILVDLRDLRNLMIGRFEGFDRYDV